MKVTETNFRKPTLNKVTVAKLVHHNKDVSKKDFTYITITRW